MSKLALFGLTALLLSALVVPIFSQGNGRPSAGPDSSSETAFSVSVMAFLVLLVVLYYLAKNLNSTEPNVFVQGVQSILGLSVISPT
jgi:hypothetical protein